MKQQDWILRYAKVEGEGGFSLAFKNKAGKIEQPDPPADQTKTPSLDVYKTWGKYFNAPTYAKWTIEYEYLYIDATLAKKAKLDQDGILALIKDGDVKARVKALLKGAGKTLGKDSAEILSSETWLWPNNSGIIAADFRKKK